MQKILKMQSQENHISVKRTARYFTLGELNEKTESIWIALHGYGFHAGYFIKKFEPIVDDETFVVAPEGLNRFYKEGFTGHVGATWMTKEDRINEIKDYVFYLNSLAAAFFEKVDRGSIKLNVLGFSQGAATMVRWLNDRQVEADNLIVWCSKIPDDFDYKNHMDLFSNSKNYLRLGNADPFMKWADPDKYLKIYEKHGLDFDFEWFDGKHEILERDLTALRSKMK